MLRTRSFLLRPRRPVRTNTDDSTFRHLTARPLQSTNHRYVSAIRERVLIRQVDRQAVMATICGGGGIVLLVLTAIAFDTHDNQTLQSPSWWWRLAKTQLATNASSSNPTFQIEVNFMDRLAQKGYLRFLGGTSSFKSSSFSDSLSVLDPALQRTTLQMTASERPAGVPRTLRLLIIDVPEIPQQGFCHGTCRKVLDRSFPHGIAPDKRVTVSTNNNNKNPTNATTNAKITSKDILVEQKVWINEYWECYHSPSRRQSTTSSSSLDPTHGIVGVQLMHATTLPFNPRNVRRRIQLGNWVYTLPASSQKDTTKDTKLETSTTTTSESGDTTTSLDFEEIDAPWNQYAWVEEIELRIRGQVDFGAPLQATPPTGFYWWWSPQRWFRSSSSVHPTVTSNHNQGSVYQATLPRPIPTSWYSMLGPVYWWRLLKGLGRSRLSREESGLLDGQDLESCISNKPHAVIANGAALQRLPHSLRWLQRLCKEENIPLYVIKDPRPWGDHGLVGKNDNEEDIGEVLRMVRRNIKQRIVATSLQSGTAFERGRLVGKWQTEASWKSKELLRKTKESLQSAEESRIRKQDMDWRKLDREELEQQLERRGVITTSIDQKDTTTSKQYSESFVAVAKKCLQETQGQGRDRTTTRNETTPKTESL